MDQWRSEVERRVVPGRLSVQVYHGPNRTKSPREYARTHMYTCIQYMYTYTCTCIYTMVLVKVVPHFVPPSLYLVAYYVMERMWDV